MNQVVRLSDLRGGDAIQEPSADLRVPFTKVGAFSCKFIIGDADANAVCCGAPTTGKSWCAYHRRIVFDVTKSSRPR